MTKMMSVKDVAEELGVCKLTVYRWIKNGNIGDSFIKRIGKTIRISSLWVDSIC